MKGASKRRFSSPISIFPLLFVEGKGIKGMEFPSEI